MLRKVIICSALLSLAVATPVRADEAKPAAAPKCSAVPTKSFPAPAEASAKQGRFAACLAAKDCKESEENAIAALGGSFCAQRNYDSCRTGTCDNATMACMPDFRSKDSKGIKLSQCISRPNKIACPKNGEELCLCDLELEAKGNLTCGCSCQLAPTPTPSAR